MLNCCDITCNISLRVFRFSWILFRCKSSAGSVIEALKYLMKMIFYPISWYNEKLIKLFCLYRNSFDWVYLFPHFFYLKITTTTSYIQLLQDNIQDCKQVQTFFLDCSLLKFLLHSRKDNYSLTSLRHLASICDFSKLLGKNGSYFRRVTEFW